MSKRINPLNINALTVEDIRGGEKILCWKPGDPTSVQHLELMGAAYTDDENDLVIRVRDSETGANERVLLTSEIGLTNSRYSENWSAIAIHDDQSS